MTLGADTERGRAALLRLLSPVRPDDPYKVYAELRESAPVCRLTDGRFFVSGYDAAERVLQDAESFRARDAASADAWWPGWRDHPCLRVLYDSPLFSNGPEHAQVRRVIARPFARRFVDGAHPVIREEAERLLGRLEDLSADGPVDFMAEFAHRFPAAVILRLLGLQGQQSPGQQSPGQQSPGRQSLGQQSPGQQSPDPRNPGLRGHDEAWVASRARAFVSAVEHIPGDDLSAADAATVELIGFLRQEIPRASGPLQRLYAEYRSGVDDDLTGFAGNVVFLLAAASDTVTGTLGNGVGLLLDRPDEVAALRDRVSVAAWVAELLRYEPPTHFTTRFAVSDTTLDGVEIPAGSVLAVIFAAANRDPLRFEDPDAFRPGRPARPPALTFSAGAHFCPGAFLARAELEIAFELLFTRFERFRAAGPAYRERSFLLRSFATLPMTVSD